MTVTLAYNTTELIITVKSFIIHATYLLKNTSLAQGKKLFFLKLSKIKYFKKCYNANLILSGGAGRGVGTTVQLRMLLHGGHTKVTYTDAYTIRVFHVVNNTRILKVSVYVYVSLFIQV